MRDKAAFVRASIHQARDDGPAQFAHRIRSILRTGRSFKTPTLLPCLNTPQGLACGRPAVSRAFGDHFALAERGARVEAASLVDAGFSLQSPPVALHSHNMPSVVDLAICFATLKSGKAAGLSGLPAEVFKLFPQKAALTYFPLMAKIVSWGMQPIQFTGGLAHVIPKSEKAPGELASWRSIMLLEADAKAMQKAFRPGLMAVYGSARAPGQFGGMPGNQLSLPSFLVRGHLLFLQARSLSGGVLFVDCKSAYYSVVREYLATAAPDRTDDGYVSALAERLFHHPHARAHFVRTLGESDLLDTHGASAELRQYVEAQFRCTWFVTARG